MPAKLNRSYSLSVQKPPVKVDSTTTDQQDALAPNSAYTRWIPSEEAIEIAYPLTIQFNIERTTSSAMNIGNFSIYNLAQTTYEQLAKDMYNLNDSGNGQEYRKVIFQAGYQELSTIFQGSLIEGWTERQGTELVTHLRCQDGLYQVANSYTNQTFQGGTSMNNIFSTLLQNLGLQKGVVGEIPEDQAPLRSAVYNGNTFQLLQNNFNNRIFIDLEKVNLLSDDEVFEGQVPLISSQTGLLGVPRRQNTYIQVDIIFEPRIQVGQIVEIVSQIDPRFNGQWKVQGITHSGTISGAIGGDCKTTLQLYRGTKELRIAA